MRLTADDVLHSARLARLRLDPGEVEQFRRELSSILDYMDLLGDIDTRGIEPTVHVHALTNALREDVAGPSMPREEALRGAPSVHEGSFDVPMVIEEG
ncbi:MAG TPA: Asp-tRNA(Asn)/Glu-tRNA(Gln) amidotransferase subunit GatC [Deltaproteobacteria bacterium]|nr:Asp-tRNA(Asn)/Glu-tRNA(Gln) amidotransferase subunit GatC [Deltaproteobacteria bacterium]